MNTRTAEARPTPATEQWGDTGSGWSEDRSSRLESVKDRLSGPWNWNKIGMGVGAAAAVAGAAYAARKMTSSGEDDFQLRLQTDESLRLISSKKVEGTPVVDKDGRSIGTIDNFMVDKYTGRVAYAVMRFGGTWGFGSSLFPLPWPVLDYDEEAGGYKLDITKDELKDAPRFEEASEPEFDASYRQRIILFYRPN